MRRSFSLLFRNIAMILVMTIPSAGVAMASYVCPAPASAEMSAQLMGGMPCAGMDSEQPAHCAEMSADTQASLELHHSPHPVAPFSLGVLVLVTLPIHGAAALQFWPGGSLEAGPAPPYLRTLRIQV
ncbi:hypothetical protein CR105_26255 [Massilia eurypsychrophila]|uniref:Copper resistance protein n=1 Tax=Massilia eurypsychrophila TaxID=1485217 RepID=A0A2G8T8R7_9BURK|nr:hypothetical protein CR105_26255 [Massilia eurypsychrophila]